MLLNLIIVCTEYVTYYGILIICNMSVENLNGSIYINLMLLSLADSTGSFMASYLIAKIGNYKA